MQRLAILLLLLLTAISIGAKRVRLFGYVLDEENRGIELVNVVLENSTTGTTTNRNGFYDLQLELNDTVVIAYSMLGYQTIRQLLYTERDVIQINVVMTTDAELLDEVEVKSVRRQNSMLDHIDAEAARLMPDAAGGSIESLLITFTGVSQNNEMSSQYNVRGGSFDENEVYVNGIEIHRPLLIRAGQQEGLSFVNPYMTQSVQFAAGGFDAQYGDKMSSVLDITYKKPTQLEATISASLLGANAYFGIGSSQYSTMHSIRYKTSKYMLGALPTKGNYQPNFIDYQTYNTFNISRNGRWQMAILANYSQNSYQFSPSSFAVSSGTMSEARELTIAFDGQERDLFRTAFAAISAQGKINDNINLNFDLSGFYTDERERFDITSEYFLTVADSQTDKSNQTELRTDSVQQSLLGTGLSQQHARNTLKAGVVTLAHNGQYKKSNNTLKWGASLQTELIADHILEWERQDSMAYTLPNTPDNMQISSSIRGDAQLRSIRAQAYLQDTYKWDTRAGQVLLTTGLRFNLWSVNLEPLISPRLSLIYQPGWKRDFTFRFATGLYYQAPFYKELRDTITNQLGITTIRLNQDIKAQRSVHAILGADYYFRAWGRPFKLTAEIYYKYIDRLVSYTVDNVRVRYSGKNDSEGFTTGLDLKLYGELVPGAESWISFSTMVSRERYIGTTQWLMAPQEQRYSFSMLFQDYIPRFPQYKLHLKTIFSDGLPYFNPKNTLVRWHMKPYMRIDIGASRTFSAKTDKFMQKARHVKSWALMFEVFNLVDFKNVNSYYWVTDIYNMQWATPNYLTGRMFNFKFIIDFK